MKKRELRDSWEQCSRFWGRLQINIFGEKIRRVISFEMTYTKAKRLQYSRGSYFEVGATMTSDNGACELDYVFDSKMTREMCKEENAGLVKGN